MTAPGGVTNFLETISNLTQMRQRQRQLDDAWDQHQEQVRQFNKVQGTKEIYSAVEALDKMEPEQRAKFIALLSQQGGNTAGMEGYAQAAPVDPSHTMRRDMMAGRAAMTPQQVQAAGQEAYTGKMTGMNMGAMGQSQMLAQGAQNGMMGMDPQQLKAANDAYALRVLTGMGPTEFGITRSTAQQGLIPGMARVAAGVEMTAAQKAANLISTGQLAQGWSSLSLQEQELGKRYGLEQAKFDYMKQNPGGAGGAGGATQGQINDLASGAAKILSDMETNAADKNTNRARARIWNSIFAPWFGMTFPEDGTVIDSGLMRNIRTSVLPEGVGNVGIGAPASAPPAAAATIRGGQAATPTAQGWRR